MAKRQRRLVTRKREGLLFWTCPKCQQKLPNTAEYFSAGRNDCKACQINKQIDMRRKWEADGICISCGKRSVVNGKKNCEICLRVQRDQMKRLRLLRKESGLCVSCSSTDVVGKALCQACITQIGRHHKSRTALADANYLCRICLKAPREVNDTRCFDCIIFGRERRNSANAKLREQLFMLYGAICVCCGEQDMRFLSLDHVNNDGAVERRRRKTYEVYKRALKDREDFQVLCYNCNMGKFRNGGICPHQDVLKILAS